MSGVGNAAPRRIFRLLAGLPLLPPRDRGRACDRRSLSLPTTSDFADSRTICESIGRIGKPTPGWISRLLAGLPPRPIWSLRPPVAVAFHNSGFHGFPENLRADESCWKSTPRRIFRLFRWPSPASPRDRIGACDRRSLSLSTTLAFADSPEIVESIGRIGNPTPRWIARLLAGLPPDRPVTDLELATAGRFRFPQLRVSRISKRSSSRSAVPCRPRLRISLISGIPH
jgi:hypothetical protein